jgi:hypothetical protein
MTDTGTEAVERLAVCCLAAERAMRAAGEFPTGQGILNDAAATLRAIAAERDAALARAEELGRELNRVKYGEPDFAWSSHLAAMNELRARAERAEAGMAVPITSQPGELDMPAVLGIIQWRGEHDIPVDNYDEAVDRAEAALRRIEATTLERAALAVAQVEIGYYDGTSAEWHPYAGPTIISGACAAIRALNGGTDE